MDRITYVSTATASLTEEAVDELVQSAGQTNSEHRVTGCLVFNGVNFLQTVEGDTLDVRFVMARIRTSRLHEGIVILLHEKDIDRVFGDWSMCRLDLKSPTASWPSVAPESLLNIYENFQTLARLP